MYDNAIESHRGVLASLRDQVIRNRMLEKSAIYLILAAVLAAAAVASPVFLVLLRIIQATTPVITQNHHWKGNLRVRR